MAKGDLQLPTVASAPTRLGPGGEQSFQKREDYNVMIPLCDEDKVSVDSSRKRPRDEDDINDHEIPGTDYLLDEYFRFKPMGHWNCTNCTGTLWGLTCMECGHHSAQDDDLFDAGELLGAKPPETASVIDCVLAYDDRMLLHEEAHVDKKSSHPERPDRIRAVMARLKASALSGVCRHLPVREATRSELEECHTPDLIDAIQKLSRAASSSVSEGVPTLLRISPDTYLNEHTAMCAALSAGACIDVATAVAMGKARSGIAIVRPPGHHAESNTAMGFCFYNNAAIAARAAQASGARRVIILDWDVHHGNGTQHIFYDDPSVLYASLHRYDGGTFYPGTGGSLEVGTGRGKGYTVNIPWPCGRMQNADYISAFHHIVLPICYTYQPNMIIISAGFDAADGDPIGGCHLTPECYAHMTAMLQLIAPTCALLEGGYNLLATAASSEACVRVLLGERPPPLPPTGQHQTPGGVRGIAAAAQALKAYWPCLQGLEFKSHAGSHGAGRLQEEDESYEEEEEEEEAKEVLLRRKLSSSSSESEVERDNSNNQVALNVVSSPVLHPLILQNHEEDTRCVPLRDSSVLWRQATAKVIASLKSGRLTPPPPPPLL